MTTLFAFLTAGLLLFVLFNLIVGLFSKARRKRKFRLAMLGFVATFVSVVAFTHFDNEEAIAEGYASSNDRTAAKKAGITNPLQWQSRKAEEVARVEAKRKADEEARRQAAEMEAREAAERIEREEAEAKAKAKAEEAAKQEKTKACRKDIKCWGEEFWAAATVRCPAVIESLAKWDYEWTDSWSEVKFDRYRWKDQEAGIVTYIGDKIKMQNGFGAWKHVSYSCDYDPTLEMVLDAAVAE